MDLEPHLIKKKSSELDSKLFNKETDQQSSDDEDEADDDGHDDEGQELGREAWEEPRAGNYGIGGTLRDGSGKGRQGGQRRAKDCCATTKTVVMMMTLVAVMTPRR